MKTGYLPLVAVLIAACGATGQTGANTMVKDIPAGAEVATLAGGCFWCMEPPFEGLKGVYAAVSGYSGGSLENPTYQQVCDGTTGHAEVVNVYFDPKVISFREILDVFWRNIDPTTKDRQFADRGTQYRTAIFYHNEEQRKIAEASRDAMNRSGKYDKPIVTEITAFRKFYAAEDYHQDYYKKNYLHYKMYRSGSGREAYIEKMWGKQ